MEPSKKVMEAKTRMKRIVLKKEINRTRAIKNTKSMEIKDGQLTIRLSNPLEMILFKMELEKIIKRKKKKIEELNKAIQYYEQLIKEAEEKIKAFKNEK